MPRGCEERGVDKREFKFKTFIGGVSAILAVLVILSYSQVLISNMYSGRDDRVVESEILNDFSSRHTQLDLNQVRFLPFIHMQTIPDKVSGFEQLKVTNKVTSESEYWSYIDLDLVKFNRKFGKFIGLFNYT